jgi:hypothetical protein
MHDASLDPTYIRWWSKIKIKIKNDMIDNRRSQLIRASIPSSLLVFAPPEWLGKKPPVLVLGGRWMASPQTVHRCCSAQAVDTSCPCHSHTRTYGILWGVRCQSGRDKRHSYACIGTLALLHEWINARQSGLVLYKITQQAAAYIYC